jgi:HK97 family phage major capsid protein
MSAQIIGEAVESLNRAFEEFKTANDHRLHLLETKNAADPLIEEKVTKLNELVEKAQTRLSHLEVAAKRPQVGHINEKDSTRKAEFFSYIRKGMEGLEHKSLTSLNDASGGYLIPPTMLDKIHSNMAITSPMRSIARSTSISTDALELLQEKGDADVGWVAETAERPETQTPELRKIRIPVHQIYAKPRASQKLLDDSTIDIETWLSQKIAEKMTITENASFIHGDGNGKPRGFLTYEIVEVGKPEWGKIEAIHHKFQNVLTDGDVLMDAFHALKAQYLQKATWLMSRSAMAAVRKLKGENRQYLWQPSMIEGTPSTLLGCPVIVADDMPDFETKKGVSAIAFGNFHEAYQIVDRAGLHILRDPFSAKPYVEFYATKRVGGDVINFDALKIIHFIRA